MMYQAFHYQMAPHSTFYPHAMLLYKPIRSCEDFSQLQSDINWVDHNHLILNPAKCKAMFISRKTNSGQPLQFNDTPLETFKYLEVFLSSDLLWAAHIDPSALPSGLLHRRFYNNVDNHTLLELYSYITKLEVCTANVFQKVGLRLPGLN